MIFRVRQNRMAVMSIGLFLFGVHAVQDVTNYVVTTPEKDSMMITTITKKEKAAATKRFNQKIANLKAQGEMWCSLCDRVKSLSEFDDSSKHYCRECEKACQKAKRHA